MGTEFAQWVSELEGHNQEQDVLEKTPEENLKDLEQEMKLLHWHKLANEAALKAALIKTKRLKKKESMERGSNRQSEKAAWMQQVIQEEQAKPLEVSEEYIRMFNEREEKDDERVERDMQRHLNSLHRIKQDVEKREELKRRNQLYKEKKLLLEKRAKAVQDASLKRGKYGSVPQAIPDDLLDSSTLRQETAGLSTFSSPSSPSTSTLGKVASSLDKLVELEKRISQLEREYDETAEDSRKGMIKFEKQRVAGTGLDPPKTTYHVRVKQPNKLTRKRVSATTNEQPQTVDQELNDEDVGGTFLTALHGSKPKSSTKLVTKTTSVVRSKARSSALVTAKSSTRSSKAVSRTGGSASKATSSRVRSRLQGAQKQDAVVSKWLNARAGSKSTGKSHKSTALVTRGTGSKKMPSAKDRLKEFKQIRQQYSKKKEATMRSLHARYDGPIRRTGRTSTSSSTSSQSSAKRARGMVVRNVGANKGRLNGVRLPESNVSRKKTTVATRKGVKTTATNSKSKKLVGRNGASVRSIASKEKKQGAGLGLGIVGTGAPPLLPRIR